MPYVSVRLAGDPPTAEQKAEVIEKITDVLVNVLDKNRATTVVVIDSVPTDNWGIGGETVTVRRKKAAQSS